MVGWAQATGAEAVVCCAVTHCRVLQQQGVGWCSRTHGCLAVNGRLFDRLRMLNQVRQIALWAFVVVLQPLTALDP